MIRFQTLGSLDLRSSDGAVLTAVVAQPKRVALLAYLALARPSGFHRRDRLLSLFWPELDDAHARNSLNTAIRFLRQALGSDVLVSRGADEIGLDTARVSCDAAEFCSAIDDGRLADAVALYGGDLLDGFFAHESRGFEEWLETERAELKARAAHAARLLADQEEAAGNITRALRWGRKAASLASNDERAIRRWLALLVRAGDRAGAMQAYEEFARRLADEYEAEPSAETRAFLDVIRRDPPARTPMTDAPASPAGRSAASHAGPAEPNALSVRVGHTLAGGRYVIEGELGAGGMATVYLAHDVRHDRRVAVKVLRPDIARTVGRDGFLREIRIAAHLQHPHIVPVFDSGVEAGQLYYVMPHVAGESLRARLSREGRLPFDDAIRIACEVADALAYAHKHGVVHRDIKPENVLLTGGSESNDAHAMVTDFGIACAIARAGADDHPAETGVVIGSATYMSPEQFSGGNRADARSDVYSLGCVLYEMLAGKPPFGNATRFAVSTTRSDAQLPSLLERRPDVTPQAQAVVERALDRSPENRYANAAELGRAIRQLTTENRGEPIVPWRLTWRWAARGGAAAVVLLATLTVVWGASRTLGLVPHATRGANGGMGPTDRVFVADFESPAPDSVLGDVATDLVMTEIRRSAVIPLVDAKQRQLALMALGLPNSSRIHLDRAREFASRANAKVYLAGAVDAVGSTYVLRATLYATEDGTELERFRQQAKSADDLITAIDRLGRDVRARLGVALSDVRGAPELRWAVTPSLTAARFYTEAARRAGVTGDLGASSIPLLERAVGEDSTFAMAYQLLSAFLANSGSADSALWAAERAFRYREKLPRHVQFTVEGVYYSTPGPDYDLDKAIQAYEAAAEISPGGPSSPAFNALGVLYVRKRDFERALTVYRAALKLDSSSFAAQNIYVPLWATGRKAEARANVARNLARLSKTATFVWAKASLASSDFFVDSAAAILAQGLNEFRNDNRIRSIIHFHLTATERTRGHIASALQHQDSAAALGQNPDTSRLVATSVLYRADILTRDLGRPAEARRLLESFVATHPIGKTEPMSYRWLDLAKAFARAGAPAKAHAVLANFERRASTGEKIRARQSLELARGEIALAEKRYSDAISAFRAADVEYCTICALPPLADAYDRAGNADSAIVVFERYLTTNWWGRTGVDQVWLAWTYKRLGELHQDKGHFDKAAIYYDRFIDLWKDADPELQPKVAEVRKRLAALR